MGDDPGVDPAAPRRVAGVDLDRPSRSAMDAPRSVIPANALEVSAEAARIISEWYSLCWLVLD